MTSKYIIISPVFNEEKFLPDVIESVISQTVLPKLWIIVDDHSTDKSRAIIDSYAKKHKFIKPIKSDLNDSCTYYGRRVYVLLQGFELARKYKCDYIGVLDGDIILESDYYKNILRELNRNKKLGIASGIYVNKINNKFDIVRRPANSTPGGLQLFRRQCFEDIGGYVPLKYGGSDTLADTMAQMFGWEARSFDQYRAVHLRPVGIRGESDLKKLYFRLGLQDFALGYHPLFMLAKSLRRMIIEKPYITNGAARFVGYLSGYFNKDNSEISPDIKRFIRKLQFKRFYQLLK